MSNHNTDLTIRETWKNKTHSVDIHKEVILDGPRISKDVDTTDKWHLVGIVYKSDYMRFGI